MEKVAIFLHTRRPGTDIASLLSEQAAQQQYSTKKGILYSSHGAKTNLFRGNLDKKERAEDGSFAFFVN